VLSEVVQFASRHADQRNAPLGESRSFCIGTRRAGFAAMQSSHELVLFGSRPSPGKLLGSPNCLFGKRTGLLLPTPLGFLAWLLLAAILLPGCSTSPPVVRRDNDPKPIAAANMREGDSVKIAFPGAPALDTTQQVRRDGKVTLPLGGEIVAAGKTPADIEKEILRLHGEGLAVKQVVVTVTSSAYPVFVSGAVLRPGKLLADRPMTLLEAIMEAGGFDQAKANLKKVMVLREAQTQTVSYAFDMRDVITGSPATKPFYLEPGDKIHVPQKFNWF
jgi:polysaccharide export outer membrane protein